MTKLLVVVAVAMTLTLAVAATAQARSTVTRATLQSGIVDREGSFFPASCDEQQVINANDRKETFRCTFPEGPPDPIVCDTAVACSWFSDFDGTPAASTHWVITPSGILRGWASY